MNSLIVLDDDRSFGALVGKIAASAGFGPALTDNAKDFWRAIEAAPDPDVVILDLQMPDSDGFEILRELAARKCKTKVILVSGAVDSRTMNTARRLGETCGLAVAEIMQKPIRVADLQALLARLREPSEIGLTEDSLRDAIAQGHLFLVYQPKIEIRTRRLKGVEALVRWRDSSGRTIGPDAFIPLAEKSSLINDLTFWVFDATCRQVAAWATRGLDINAAVNLSAGNINDHRLPDRLAAICQQHDVAPDRLTLELTETASMQNIAMMLEVLGRFRVKGFNLSMDDFGAGYSSIMQLLKMPFSELKLDRSFVVEMDRNREAAIIAKTIIDLGHNLGLSVVAEGVESATVLGMLAEYGCDLAQGYYLSAPVDAGSIERFSAASFLRDFLRV